MTPYGKYSNNDVELPQWQEMGNSEAPNINPLIEQLKKRMMKKPAAPTGDLSYSDMLSGSIKTPSNGGKSL